MKITLREMTPEDWDTVSSIYLEGIESNLATFQTTCPTYEEWDRGHLEACRIVAEIDGQVAGWVALSSVSSRPVYRGVAELSIYIGNEYQNKGIGSKLLNYLNQDAEEKEFWTLQSLIMADNERSVALHKKCGYRVVGVREKMGKDQYGRWRDIVLMERRNNYE